MPQKYEFTFAKKRAFTWYKVMKINISLLHKYAFTAAQIPSELHILCSTAR